MSTILNHIHEDHLNMVRLLDILDNEIADLEAGDDHDYNLIFEIMSYFNHYPNRFHHPFEDKVFAWMTTERPTYAGLVNELRVEHETQAALGRELELLLKAICAGGHMVPRDKVVADLKEYVTTQRQHIDKEEGELLKGTEELLADHHMIEIPLPDRAALDLLFGDEVDESYASLALRLEP